MKKLLLIFSIVMLTPTWANDAIKQSVLLLNQQDYAQAQTILERESNLSNADATFWLGVVQYRNQQHFVAGDTFLKAAEMGNPWAMGVLTGEYYTNNPCDYLGWPCDAKWKSKAIEGWEKLSNEGNGKATLQLQFFTNKWRQYVPVLGRNLIDESYVKALKQGGNNAIFYIVSFSKFSAEEKVQLMTIAAEQGYAPAMTTLYYYMEIIGQEKAEFWVNKAIELGYAPAAEALYFSYRQGRGDVKPDPKKAYYYSELVTALGGEDRDSFALTRQRVKEDGIPKFDENGNAIWKVLVTEEEQRVMDKQVAEFVKDIKPNMFLDETSIDLF